MKQSTHGLECLFVCCQFTASVLAKGLTRTEVRRTNIICFLFVSRQHLANRSETLSEASKHWTRVMPEKLAPLLGCVVRRSKVCPGLADVKIRRWG